MEKNNTLSPLIKMAKDKWKNFVNENNMLNFDIKTEKLPLVIAQTIYEIFKIDKNIREAEKSAQEATESAKIAKSKSAGWSLFGSDKKEAIEALQKAVIDISNALSSFITATNEQFKQQKLMVQAINFLYRLSACNMATHRTIVSILEEKLQDTSKGVLSEFAQRELEGVIMQLRAQNDQWLRIDKHDGILREHHEELAEIKHSLHTIEKCLLDINTQKNS